MTHFTKNVLCSVFLATADFIGFVLSLYASVREGANKFLI